MKAASEHTLVVKKGLCFALYAYDIGFAIDLDKCRVLFSTKTRNAAVRHNRRAPRYFDYDPEPLPLTVSLDPVQVGDFLTQPGVDVLLYDFGAASICFTIPFDGPLHSLCALTGELGKNPRLFEESRRQVESLIATMGEAISKPRASSLTEDYAILQVSDFDAPCGVADVPVRMAQDLARVLRAEQNVLSPEEVTDAMACRISYGANDVAVIDWNAALLIDKSADDVRAVLDFANMELLEMRHLDRKLDKSLDEAYEILSRHGMKKWWRWGASRADMRRIAAMQLDGAILFERVSNAPKLLGDQYLARVYRLASQRFHLSEWNASILRKLEATDGFYKKMSERAASMRLEVLEWIIIILILIEMVMSIFQ